MTAPVKIDRSKHRVGEFDGPLSRAGRLLREGRSGTPQGELLARAGGESAGSRAACLAEAIQRDPAGACAEDGAASGADAGR